MQITLNGTKVTLSGSNIGFSQNNLVNQLRISVDTTTAWSYKLDVIYPSGLTNIIDLPRVGNTCTVNLTSTMLAESGKYRCQIRGINGDQVYHTNIFEVFVKNSLNVTAARSPLSDEELQFEQEMIELADEAKAEVAKVTGMSVSATTLAPGSSATVTKSTGQQGEVHLTYGIPKGDKGDTGQTGATGNGIQSIVKTGTSGLVDTYTITYTNGDTVTYTVTNGAKGDKGEGISSITKTSTSGLEDTYTITFTDGSTTTFKVTNGKGITNIAKTSTAGLVDTYTITFNDGTTSTYAVTNGAKGDTGDTGNGISSITLNEDYTLTINYTNGTSMTTASIRGATGATGNGISSIAKTSTAGKVDTYTITFTNGSTTTFNVTNGNDGANTVSVSATGTATNEVKYITINGTESKLAGGAESVGLSVVNGKLCMTYEEGE